MAEEHAGSVPVLDAEKENLPENVDGEAVARELRVLLHGLHGDELHHGLLVPLQLAEMLGEVKAEEPERTVLGKEHQRVVDHLHERLHRPAPLLAQHHLQIEIPREILGGGRDVLAELERHLLIAQLRENPDALHQDLHRLLRVHELQLVDDDDHVLHAPQPLLHAQPLLQEQLVVRVLRARGLQHHARVRVLPALHLQPAELQPHLHVPRVLHHQLHEDRPRPRDPARLLLLDPAVDQPLDRRRVAGVLQQRRAGQLRLLRLLQRVPDGPVHRQRPQRREVHRRRDGAGPYRREPSSARQGGPTRLKARERVHGARGELGSVDPGGGVEGAHPVDVQAVQIEAVAEPEDAARGRGGVEGLRGHVDPEIVGRRRPGVSVRVLIGISVAARRVGEVGEVVEGGVGVGVFGRDGEGQRAIGWIHGAGVAERCGRLVQRGVKIGGGAGRVAPVLLGIGVGGVGRLPAMAVIHGVVHVAVHRAIVA